MITLLTCWMAAAMAGPGFSGVGGPDKAPGFDATEPANDGERLAEVLRRESELLELVKRHDPTMHARLTRLASTNRPAYLAALVRVHRNVERARSDPAYRARVQAVRSKTAELEALTHDYRRGTAADRARIRPELVRAAGELMDLKQEDRRSRVQELQARLAELQAEIDRREQNREQIIEDFVDRMVRGPVDL